MLAPCGTGSNRRTPWSNHGPVRCNCSEREGSCRNTATGFAATQESSQGGDFHFSYLPVGEYDLHVSASGFADFSANHIRIDVDRIVNFAVSLELRSRGDLIDVIASAATVDVSSTLGNVVSSQQAVELPSTAAILPS